MWINIESFEPIQTVINHIRSDLLRWLSKTKGHAILRFC